MPNTSYMSQPLTDWSSEISAPQTAASPAPGMTGPFQYPPAPMPADMPPAFQFPSAGTSAGSSGTPAPSRPAAPPASAAPSPAGAAASTDSTGSAGSTGSTSPTGSSGSTSSAGAAASAGPVSSVPAVRPPARHPAHNEFAGSTGDLDLRNHQPAEVIEAPTTTGEAFLGSLKAMLLRNRGNFVTATFLIGTQGTTAWEGILHDVGNDYLIIYQPGRERYIACDIYSLKYIEFYDTRRRELCETMLRQSGMQNSF